MRSEKAREEEEKYRIVHSLDPKRIFSPKYVKKCEIGKHTPTLLGKLSTMKCNTFKDKKVKDLEQMIMTDHGIPLYKTSFIEFHSLKYYVREVKRLLYCAMILRSNGYSHMDLHPGNILVDPSSGKCTVIDFGELTRDKDIYEYIQRRVFTKKDYTQFPPELILLSIIVSHKNREGIGRVLGTLDDKILYLLHKGGNAGRASGVILGELRKRSKYHAILAEFLDPKEFPESSRENLFSLRCKAILTLHTLIRSKKSFAYACAMSFVTIDSYAIGLILSLLSQKISMRNLEITNTNEFQVIQKITKRLVHSNISERMSAKEALEIIIDLNKR